MNSFHGAVILALAFTVNLLFTFLEYLTVCDIHSYCPRIWLDLFELLMLLLYKGNKISCHVQHNGMCNGMYWVFYGIGKFATSSM